MISSPTPPRRFSVMRAAKIVATGDLRVSEEIPKGETGHVSSR